MANNNMKVITIMTRKGGAGKTTLATALISAALSQGKTCLALDADPQQSLHRWAHRLNISDPLFTIEQLSSASDLETRTDQAWEEGKTDFIFVDTLGAAGAWADDLAAFSDALIVPMMLGDRDLEITTDTFNWYCGLRERTDDPENLPTFQVLLSRIKNKLTVANKTVEQEALARFPVMDDYFMERNQHADADQKGFLHMIAQEKRSSDSGLIRTHAKYFDEALEEASSILAEIVGKS